MKSQLTSIIGALVIAAATAGCAPSETDTVAKVKANLTADTTVLAAPIEVGAQKKVVTLTGTVDSAAIKEQAVVIARKTDGVGEVVDHPWSEGTAPVPEHSREAMEKMGPGGHGQAPKDDKRP